MKNQITPCLWFDNKAKEAAEFYCSVFPETVITSENHIVVTIESSGQKFILLNGGPHFTINPSVSFFVVYETSKEVEEVWDLLMKGGSALMPLDKYDWSEKYGWVQDKFGVSWQISVGKENEFGQKFSPSLLFTNKFSGKAEQAIRFYTTLFDESSIDRIERYTANDYDVEGTIKFAQFRLGNQVFMAMDSTLSHTFSFNEAVSFVVECKTQDEIDFYWDKLSAVPEAEQCGWLKDQFGVSWQIVPSILGELMSDPSRSGKVIQAFMQMKKFDIEKLITA